jgi:hypothetical protein
MSFNLSVSLPVQWLCFMLHVSQLPFLFCLFPLCLPRAFPLETVPWLQRAPENPGRHSQMPLMWWQDPLLCTQRGQGWAQPWP